MVIVAIIEGIALLAVTVFALWLYQDFQQAQRDLLDRLMSRDWTEYRNLKIIGERKARSIPMTDEKEALIEKTRKV